MSTGRVLSEREKEELDDLVGDLYSELITDKGLSFTQAKKELRASVSCFIGHVDLDLD